MKKLILIVILNLNFTYYIKKSYIIYFKVSFLRMDSYFLKQLVAGKIRKGPKETFKGHRV